MITGNEGFAKIQKEPFQRLFCLNVFIDKLDADRFDPELHFSGWSFNVCSFTNSLSQ
jgi:hypothetical protein